MMLANFRDEILLLSLATRRRREEMKNPEEKWKMVILHLLTRDITSSFHQGIQLLYICKVCHSLLRDVARDLNYRMFLLARDGIHNIRTVINALCHVDGGNI